MFVAKLTIAKVSEKLSEPFVKVGFEDWIATSAKGTWQGAKALQPGDNYSFIAL